ncbi:MAG: branched-chain amino acid ABC transporter permease [Candidatus Lambdaproteobacteria bacterium]|nr:branched-chain amino acid ABC transporter permease [Candidatus Lambdaproteobacteria bacterium]
MDFFVFSLAPQLLHGLVWGMAIVLVAVGLTVIFGLMGLVNFAHGELYMAGAYIAYTMLFAVPSFWLAAVVAVCAVAALGWLAERTVFRPLYGRNHIFYLLLTFGLGLILREVARLIWGGDFKTLEAPVGGSVQLLDLYYPLYRLVVLGFSAVIMLGIWLFMTRSRTGAMIRAASEDREMLAATGVDVNALFGIVFAVGAGLAALSGVLLAPIFSIYPYMGLDLILFSFIVVIVGGLGSIRGAVVAGVLIGEYISVSALWISPVYSEATVFVFLIVILVLRPEGLFGAKL